MRLLSDKRGRWGGNGGEMVAVEDGSGLPHSRSFLASAPASRDLCRTLSLEQDKG